MSSQLRSIDFQMWLAYLADRDSPEAPGMHQDAVVRVPHQAVPSHRERNLRDCSDRSSRHPASTKISEVPWQQDLHLVPHISQLRNHFNCTSGGLEPLQGV